MLKKYKCHCKRCGHNWESISAHPLRCGQCKTPYWFIEPRTKETTTESTSDKQ